MLFQTTLLFTVVSLAAAQNSAPKGARSLFNLKNLMVARQEDPQVSLTLDPTVIAAGFAQNGNPADGQVASLTSTNNFINFCATQPGLELTDGIQKAQGSCNGVPMGRIAANDRMPRSKFIFPTNLDDTIRANTAFTIQMRIENLVTGNFVNAQTNYYAAPQQVNEDGTIIGHSHVVIELLPEGFQQQNPLDPEKFAFFKGLNAAAVDGILTTEVKGQDTEGLAAGQYRLCSINAAANHQPVLVARAQHGFLDDCVYFTVQP